MLEKIQTKVTKAMNDKFLTHFTAEDVKADFSIGDFKPPPSLTVFMRSSIKDSGVSVGRRLLRRSSRP
jgi:hypothetical protein